MVPPLSFFEYNRVMKPAYMPRLGDWVFICILLAGLVLGQRMLNLDSDLGRHLTLGRYILRSGTIPTRDILSSTLANEPRPAYEWLSQIAFALVERALGLDGVVLLTAAIIAAAFLVVFADARSRGGGPLISLLLVTWAAAASSLHWLTRPHVFSFLFMAIWLCVLDRLRRGEGGATWQLPVVMLLWANFHGGFVFGLVAWVAYSLGWLLQARREAPSGEPARLLIAGAGSFGASMITPGFGAGWSAVLRNSSPYILSRTAETMPISWSTTGTWAFVALVIFTVILCVTRRRQLVAAHGVLLLIMAVMGIAIMRNIPLFCVAAVPVLALLEHEGPRRDSAIQRLEGRIQLIDSAARRSVWIPSALVLVGALMAGRHLAGAPDYYKFDSTRFPVAAVDWMVLHGLHPGIFNDLNWGGYLLYRLWPQERVFVDSQSDFYGEEFLREYEAMYAATNAWESELDRFEVGAVILPPSAPLAAKLSINPAWSVRYSDDTAILLERTGP